jgi:predicted nucleic acid-binding protein
LIYAVDRESPHHAHARSWLEKTLSEAEWVGLPWIAVLAFLHITTHPGVVRKPMTAEDAICYVDDWLGQSFVRMIAPGESHWPILRNPPLAA